MHPNRLLNFTFHISPVVHSLIQFQPSMVAVPAHQTAMWHLITDILIRLTCEIQPLETIIFYDKANAWQAEQLLCENSNLTSFVLLQPQKTGPAAYFDDTKWQTTFNNSYQHAIAIIMLSHLEPYINLIRRYPRVLHRQTVLICTTHNHDATDDGDAAWRHLNHIGPLGPLLVIMRNPVQSRITMYAWSLVWRAFQIVSVEQLLQRHNPNVQFFWNTVRRLPRPPVFRIDFLPPSHLNICDDDDDTSAPAFRLHNCYAFGPFVYLAKIVAHLYMPHYVPLMLPFIENDYDDNFRQLLSQYRLSRGADALTLGRSISDAFVGYDLAQRMQPWNRTSKESSDTDEFILMSLSHGLSFIYPIYFDSLRLIVPSAHNSAQNGGEKSTDRSGQVEILNRRWVPVGAWAGVVLSAAVVRYYAGRHVGGGDFTAACCSMWALTLGMDGGRTVRSNEALSQRWLFSVLCAYGAVASRLLGGFLLQAIMWQAKVQQIETTDELFRSNRTLIAARELNENVSEPNRFMTNVTRTEWDADGNVQWLHVMDVQRMLWMGNTNAGYVMAESNMGVLGLEQLRYANGQPVFYVAKEIISKKRSGGDLE